MITYLVECSDKFTPQAGKEDQMFKPICQTCGKIFGTEKDNAQVCYDCAFGIMTGNQLPPEEGDLNTASISSGQMTKDEKYWLARDLQSIDHSAEDVYEKEYGESEDGDHRWDYLEERDPADDDDC